VRYDAVVFDLFHTLVALETAGPAGPPLNEQLGAPKEWNTVWWRLTDGRARGRYPTNEGLFALIAQELGLPAEPERWRAAATARKARFRRALTQVEPEVLKGLQALRALGLPLGLLSDADCDEVSSWPDSPLAPLFDRAFFSCHEGLRKPETEFYRRLCRSLGVQPERCLYVGDGFSDEHVGARRVGMTPVLMTCFLKRYYPERIPRLQSRCDFAVGSVAELADVIRHA